MIINKIFGVEYAEKILQSWINTIEDFHFRVSKIAGYMFIYLSSTRHNESTPDRENINIHNIIRCTLIGGGKRKSFSSFDLCARKNNSTFFFLSVVYTCDAAAL